MLFDEFGLLASDVLQVGMDVGLCAVEAVLDCVETADPNVENIDQFISYPCVVRRTCGYTCLF